MPGLAPSKDVEGGQGAGEDSYLGSNHHSNHHCCRHTMAKGFQRAGGQTQGLTRSPLCHHPTLPHQAVPVAAGLLRGTALPSNA